MTVDFRATVLTNLGNCISGDVGSNHIGDGTGLIKTQGRLLMDGIVNPARGTEVELMIVQQQLGQITRFPKPMYVLRAVPDVLNRTSEIEIGCKLTLMEDLKRKDRYFSENDRPPLVNQVPIFGDARGGQVIRYFQVSYYYWPVTAQNVLLYCLDKIGIELSEDSANLDFVFMRRSMDLSSGYVQIIGDLIRSETKYGRILPDGTLQIRGLNFQLGRSGPILTNENIYTIEAIDGAALPPDEFTVGYNGADSSVEPRPRLSSGEWVERPRNFFAPTNSI
jgi:hypothetical protein